MSNAHKLIQDLIFFYVKENYQKYLDDNKLELIKDDKIPEVIDCIYSDKKKHIKQTRKTPPYLSRKKK